MFNRKRKQLEAQNELLTKANKQLRFKLEDKRTMEFILRKLTATKGDMWTDLSTDATSICTSTYEDLKATEYATAAGTSIDDKFSTDAITGKTIFTENGIRVVTLDESGTATYGLTEEKADKDRTYKLIQA